MKPESQRSSASATARPVDGSSDALLRERYYLGVDQTAVAALTIVVSLIVMLWNQSSQRGLLIWAALMVIAVPIPPILGRIEMPFDTWFRVLIPSEFALGAMWGSIALLAMPESEVWQAILGGVLVAILLAGSVSSSQFTRAYVSYTATVYACTFLGFMLHGAGSARIFLWLISIGWVYGMTMASEQRQLQLALVRSLRQNEALVSTLEDSNRDALNANARLAESAKKADRLARTDPLTQLANRMQFDEELDRQLEALASGEARYLTLAYIDLDNFKYVNDAHGHRTGDLLLVAVARRLDQVAQVGETFARLGGDELVLISREYDPHAVGRRLVEVFEEPFTVEGRLIEMCASVGVGTVAEAVNRDDLMRRADAAQYTAKRAGGGSFIVFGSESRHS